MFQNTETTAASDAADDQSIHGYGRWVHLAIPAVAPQAYVETPSIHVADVPMPEQRSSCRLLT